MGVLTLHQVKSGGGGAGAGQEGGVARVGRARGRGCKGVRPASGWARNALITPFESDARRCVFPSVDLEYGPLVWVPTSQMGDSEVRGAGGGEGVLTAGVTG